MSLLGRPSIHIVLFVLSKLALFGCLAFAATVPLGLAEPWRRIPAAGPLALLAAAAALALLAASLTHLGRSTRMGLPDESTELKTAGIYAWSRNPMYLGLYLGCVASCLWTPHPANLACAAAAIGLHHCIVLAEERFLALRFGPDWERYRRRVRRYVGVQISVADSQPPPGRRFGDGN